MYIKNIFRDHRHISHTPFLIPTPNPLYYTSDLLARGITAALWTCGRSARPPRPGARPKNCQPNLTFIASNNTKINSWLRSDIAVGQKVSRGHVVFRRCNITDRDVWSIKTTNLAYKLTYGAVERTFFEIFPL